MEDVQSNQSNIMAGESEKMSSGDSTKIAASEPVAPAQLNGQKDLTQAESVKPDPTPADVGEKTNDNIPTDSVEAQSSPTVPSDEPESTPMESSEDVSVPAPADAASATADEQKTEGSTQVEKTVDAGKDTTLGEKPTDSTSIDDGDTDTPRAKEGMTEQTDEAESAAEQSTTDTHTADTPVKDGEKLTAESASTEVDETTTTDKPEPEKSGKTDSMGEDAEPDEEPNADDVEETADSKSEKDEVAETTGDDTQEETTTLDTKEEEAAAIDTKDEEETTPEESKEDNIEEEEESEAPEAEEAKTAEAEDESKIAEEAEESKIAEAEDEDETTVAPDTSAKKKRGRRKASPRSSPKRPARGKAAQKEKVTDDKEEEEEAEDMETEETTETPVLGLVERPVEIMTGKRNRRKVDRLAEKISSTPANPADKKKFSLPEGEGVKLGDCPAIEEVIAKTKAEELKIFHRILFGTVGKSPMEIKKNIRAFCGWTMAVGDAEHKKKVMAMSKINMPVLKSWCAMLKLAVGGSKDAIMERIIDYLIKPTAEGKELQAKEKKPEATPTGKRKRTPAKSKPEVEESDDSSESEKEEEPVSKRRRSSPAKKTPARKSKTPAKAEARPTRGRARKAATAPPTDTVIRKQIEKILQTADLEIVTMKTVRQQVLDMYSQFDLSDKRDFIKATVKEILGA